MSDNYDGPAMAQQILRLQAEVAELKAKVWHWQANHSNEVRRAQVLKARLDVPIERIQAYEQWGKDQAERDALKADAERYRHLCERVPDPAWLNNCIDTAREVKP